jgi:hypothetical protein
VEALVSARASAPEWVWGSVRVRVAAFCANGTAAAEGRLFHRLAAVALAVPRQTRLRLRKLATHWWRIRRGQTSMPFGG